jgi:hypothetical protein
MDFKRVLEIKERIVYIESLIEDKNKYVLTEDIVNSVKTEIKSLKEELNTLSSK